MSITQNSDMHMDNTTIIRATDGSEVDSAIDYDDMTNGLSQHHIPYVRDYENVFRFYNS